MLDINKSKICIGIDVSKETLDVYLLGKSYKIQNNAKSISDFMKSDIDLSADYLCVLESTGGYERVAANVLSKFNIAVHTAHPSRVHAFAKACGHFAKTDKLDAILLHKYAEFICDKVRVDAPIDDKYQEIIALRRMSKTVEDDLHATQCRLKQMPQSCHKYLKKQITLYKAQIAAIQKEIDDKIACHEVLKAKQDLMISMKGVAKRSASILLAELPELGNLSRKQVANLVGVAPRTYQSGKKESSGHIFGGRFYARKALYMIALVASQHDAYLKEKYKQMIKMGKPKKVALVALMRSIIISLNAMLKKSQKCIFYS